MNKDHGIHEEANRTTTSCAGLTPNGLPKVQEETHVFVKNSHTGVSTNCVLKKSDLYARQHKLPPRNWFALRVTYGRERTAYDYLVSMGVKAFCPMHRVAKIIKGKRRLVMQSRLPNLFFAYGTEEELQQFVYDNTNLPFLRFYYRYYHDERHSMKKEPLIVSDEQIETFRIICESTDHGTFVSSDEIHLFERGELVRVTRGEFAGVVGRVTRFKGQQRVGIYIDGVATIATAYVPNAYLERLED